MYQLIPGKSQVSCCHVKSNDFCFALPLNGQFAHLKKSQSSKKSIINCKNHSYQCNFKFIVYNYTHSVTSLLCRRLEPPRVILVSSLMAPLPLCVTVPMIKSNTISAEVHLNIMHNMFMPLGTLF